MYVYNCVVKPNNISCINLHFDFSHTQRIYTCLHFRYETFCFDHNYI